MMLDINVQLNETDTPFNVQQLNERNGFKNYGVRLKIDFRS